jgi:hypothetical protein
MDAFELLRFLLEAGDEFGCKDLALRCECENFETVYVIERSGELAVTDRGETFKYLDRSGDEAYAQIDVERARAICRQHGVHLDDRDGDEYPEVIQVVGDKPLRAAIDAVSVVVDEPFSSAMGRSVERSD